MGVCEIGCDLEQVAVGIAEVDGYYLTEGAGAVDGTLFDGDVERFEVGDGLFGGIGGDERGRRSLQWGVRLWGRRCGLTDEG